MTRLMLGAVISLWLICPALADHLDAAAVNDAVRRAKLPAADKRIAGEASNPARSTQFSRREIDGKPGANAQRASSQSMMK